MWNFCTESNNDFAVINNPIYKQAHSYYPQSIKGLLHRDRKMYSVRMDLASKFANIQNRRHDTMQFLVQISGSVISVP